MNSHELTYCNMCNNRDSLLNSIKLLNEDIKLLKRSNIYNDVFYIWQEGPYGTINGFRMGKLHTQPVSRSFQV